MQRDGLVGDHLKHSVDRIQRQVCDVDQRTNESDATQVGLVVVRPGAALALTGV